MNGWRVTPASGGGSPKGFFFIVPDVYISFAALFSLRSSGVAWLFSIAGSVTAVLVIYLLTAAIGLDYLAFLRSVPDSGPLIGRVEGWLAAEGLPYTPLLVLRGVPLKLYAAVAFSLGLSLGSVLLWTVFARIVRIAPTFAVVAMIRLLFRRHLDAGRPSGSRCSAFSGLSSMSSTSFASARAESDPLARLPS